MSEIRKVYTKEFKEQAVSLLRSSERSCKQIAEDMGLNESVLRRWNKEIDQPNSFTGNGNPRDKEMYELKKEIALLKEERDILKKAMVIFSQRTR